MTGIALGHPTRMRYKIASIAQLLRLPAICSLCNQYHQGRLAICTDCNVYLTTLGPACQHCAHPVPDVHFLVCGQCCIKKPDIDYVFTRYQFEEPLRTLLHAFKYRENLHLLSYLGTLMNHSLPLDDYQTECLVPVPMHPKRLRQRGFNHAAELTKYLSRSLNRPYDLSLCQKRINTKPQAGLNARERRTNLRNTFASKPTPYQHITLIDDLLTTGSTANELARVLKKQGVRRVDLLCCARVIEHKT